VQLHSFLTITLDKGGWAARALWTLRHLGVKSHFLSRAVCGLVMVLTEVS